MPNSSTQLNSGSDINTYRRIRKSIGVLAMFLPIVLIILSLIPFFKTAVQSSISAYYYTNLREILVGVLCAVGLFLIRYDGTKNPSIWKNDHLLTNIAGYMAFGIAFFPTNPNDWSYKMYSLIPLKMEFLGAIHYGFAAILFLILSLISINVFTIGQNEDEAIPISIYNENNIYKICGYLILVFIIMIPIFHYFNVLSYSTLLFEALSLITFGISWLVKGRFLGDKGKLGKVMYRENN